MKLHVLPVRTGAAAENMALDFLLLQRYPAPAAPRFRHYEWRTAAFTFGYGQKIEWVRANLPSFARASEGAAAESMDLCRRPTGGGIVDHRNDWTYSLVLPRGHALYDERAAQSYRIVHECLAAALVTMQQPAEVKTECAPCEVEPALQPSPGPWLASRAGSNLRGAQVPPGEGICFQRAELYDVIHATTGVKIAGAAQKRNKHGLLFQGSIEKAAVGPVDWDDFSTRFAMALAGAIGAVPEETPWPELNEEEVEGLIEQYSSPEWVEYR